MMQSRLYPDARTAVARRARSAATPIVRRVRPAGAPAWAWRAAFVAFAALAAALLWGPRA